ncbi:MAG: thioredoxin family protein [Deltaproteobacteria bacterium]|nr:thioredoxin family protein [Deltaproteobacteria bacterium]
MNIIIIGVEPPCPRCRLLHEITLEVVHELGLQADVEKIACTSDEAQRFGRTGNAHDIAQWAGIDVDWDTVHRLASAGWSQALDDLLMPCKEKAATEGL